MKRAIDLKLFSVITATLLIAFIVATTFVSMLSYNKGIDERTTENIIKIIQKAALQCYALEGSYPPDIYYLADNYQITLNEDAYFYYYSVYADNIMPEIQVISKD